MIFNRLLIILIFLGINAQASSLMIENAASCDKLSDIIRKDSLATLSSSLDDLKSKYTFVSKFSAGKGGAFVAKIKDTSGAEKVIKIFPSIAKESNKYNYRELFYTCLNSFITASSLGYDLKPPYQNINIFPQVFEIGMTNSENFVTSSTAYVHPYMIFEFVKGKSLTTLGEEAAKNINTGAYRLYTRNQVGSYENKRRTQMVLYQIAHLLYKLKRHKFGNQEYGFYHADLNSGNVIVRDILVDGSLNAGFGNIIINSMPVVAFLDFGHQTSNLDNKLGSKVTDFFVSAYHKTLHFFSGSTAEFYENLNGTTLGKIAETAIGLSSTNSDMRLYQVIGRALYDSNNYVKKDLMEHLSHCSTATKCVDKAVKLFQ